ncbi:MAG: hypothetical protein RJA98_581 [Pseudomonadota bacterium]|jgi:CAAX prenyl protease-like protein
MSLALSRAAVWRCAPFALFMALLAARGALSDGVGLGFDARWLYGVTVLAVGGLLMWGWREYGELSRQLWPTLGELGLSVLVGVVVFWLWIQLDAPWMRLGEPSAPFRPVGADGQLEWGLIALRWLGAALLVPVMEELFWRSFLMRWVDNPSFEAVPPQRVTLKAMVLSTFVFMLAHTLWLAAIVAGLAYAWLYVRRGKLWMPIIAHAVTNGVLGVWVVLTGNWQFW